MRVTRSSFGSTRPPPGDTGQLLLLAGIILALAFLATTLTLNELSSIRADVAAEQDAPIVGEFSFVRDKINTTLGDVVLEDTTNSSLNGTFSDMAKNIIRVENAKGYDVIVAKGRPGAPVALNESDFLDGAGTSYDGRSYDGVRNFTGQPYDGVDDGIIWYKEPSDTQGHVKGLVVYLYLADQRSVMEETILYALNT